MGFDFMQTASPSRELPKRRRKTAAERRAQRLRATARATQHLLKLLSSLNHRGNTVSKMAKNLDVTLSSQSMRERRRVCKHHANGFCKYGAQCRFAHDDTRAELALEAASFPCASADIVVTSSADDEVPVIKSAEVVLPQQEIPPPSSTNYDDGSPGLVFSPGAYVPSKALRA